VAKTILTDAELKQRVTLDEKIAVDDKIRRGVRRQVAAEVPTYVLLNPETLEEIQALADEYAYLAQVLDIFDEQRQPTKGIRKMYSRAIQRVVRKALR
jgi:hypothetical protein